MENKVAVAEINKRENKGINDILDTEESCNGVFHIDELHRNGYHLYIPYGLHNYLFEALYHGKQKLEEAIRENEKTMKEAKEKAEGHTDSPWIILADRLEYDNQKYGNLIKVLDAIWELEGEV